MSDDERAILRAHEDDMRRCLACDPAMELGSDPATEVDLDLDTLEELDL